MIFVNVIINLNVHLKCTINVIKEWNYEVYIHLTTDEDQVLLDMVQYFNDLGLPDHIDSKAFESLSDKFFSNI